MRSERWSQMNARYRCERFAASVKLHFLVQEGPIGAEAVVRHAKSGGLGLKFSVMGSEDQKRLKALMARLRK
jgi:hypothetical protein